jgi:hypothetical protein
MAQKNLRFGGLKNARNFSKFQQSKDIMKTGKSTSDLRFRVLPPFFAMRKMSRRSPELARGEPVEPIEGAKAAKKR